MNRQTQEVFETFNKPDSTLVISSYPEKGVRYSGKVCAVGGFVKSKLFSLGTCFKKANPNSKFVVLTIKTGKEEIYVEDEILVWRVFERNNPLSYAYLFNAVLKFNHIKNILVEFEFASFGDSKTTALLPLLLLLLWTMRKKTTIVLHQIISNLSLLSGHLGWKKSTIKSLIYNFLLKVFLFLIVFPVRNVVVLEEIFKKRLTTIVGFKQKIHVIPHGIDRELNAPLRRIARKNLNIERKEFVLLYFGYLTWYKGIDFLIKTLSSQKEIGRRRIRLIVAGGDSITQKTKPHYRAFVNYVYSIANKASHITITGFVPERDIPTYFAAADLVILPYRALISSSGPLSFTLAFNKPFIISSPLAGYLESLDFRNSLYESGIKRTDIIFPLQRKKLIAKIESLLHPDKRVSLSKFSRILAQKRDFYILTASYAKLLQNDPKRLPSPVLSPTLSYERV